MSEEATEIVIPIPATTETGPTFVCSPTITVTDAAAETGSAPVVNDGNDAVITLLTAECARAHARCEALEALLKEKDDVEDVLPAPEAIEITAPVVAEEPPFDMWKHMGTIL